MSLHSNQLVLGIDGGGSKTLASLAVLSEGSSFHVVGRGIAGASNLNAIGVESAAVAVQLAIQRAFESASTKPRTVAALCMGMSGAGRTEEQQAWIQWAQGNKVAEQIDVVTDAQTVLAAGTSKGIGVALIAGTGSLAYGVNQAGKVARAGGWGYLLGDEGGGYQIGLAALKAITKSVDGCGPETCLQPMVLHALGLDEPRALIRYVYHHESKRSEIAALSELVFEAAETDDQLACEILQQAARELAELVQAVASRLHFTSENYALVLTGGVLLYQRVYRVSLLEQLHSMQIEPSSVECVDDSSLGAIRIAVRRWNAAK
ncbi:BadF/BadG/BcrA/BcrD ATPase family protein [uncultured Gimesia sp.]|uniref:N-acetylglucosamine kinase n=1 Tax=uncultured Gimesia sp. TaxID=1678688 RepID=UPI0030D72736|tara:strand:- start:40375 stop:41331 length:957 start_codon:yes stop_codon:yes gene_type:complete